MNENEQRPSDSSHGSEPPTNPYGQPVPPSSEQHSADDPSSRESGGSTGYPPPSYGESSHDQGQAQPYGQAPQHGEAPPPYGQESSYGQAPHYGQSSPYGQSPQPYGQPQQPAYGSDPYDTGYDTRGDTRPGTVTAAGWITIVLGVLGTLLYLGLALAVFLGEDFMADAVRSDPSFEDSGVSVDFIIGVTGALFLGLAIWSALNLLLGVLVLRRSNVARTLLIISCALTALLSLVAVFAGGAGVITLVPAVAVIVLLFVGGAKEWFARKGQASYGGAHPGSPYGG